MINKLLSISAISLFIACQSEPKKTETDRAVRQLYEQSQETKAKRFAEEKALREATQQSLSELPYYQKMQKEKKEQEEREAAQRSYSSSSNYDDLESENEELRDEVKRLKNEANSED